MLRELKVLFAAAMVIMVGAMFPGSPARAELIFLSSDPTLEAFGKTWTNFTCVELNNEGTTTGGCASLSLSLDTSLLNNPTLNIDGLLKAQGYDAVLDLKVEYDMIDSGGLVSQISLFCDCTVTSIDGAIVISESVFDENNVFLGRIFVSVPGPDVVDPPFEMPGTLDLPLGAPQDFLHVVKDIGLSCNDAACIAQLSIIKQDFEQIPEPASLGLFGIGLAGLGFLLRRRRKTAA